MKPNKIAKLRATATAASGGAMNSDVGGLISEATGMAENGYGQFGLQGRTKSGAEIKFKKPPMVGETTKDIDRMEKPTALRVTVPVDDGKLTEHEYVIRTMRELFHG